MVVTLFLTAESDNDQKYLNGVSVDCLILKALTYGKL